MTVAPPPVDPVAPEPDQISTLGTFLGGLIGGLSVWFGAKIRRLRHGSSEISQLSQSIDRAVSMLQREHEDFANRLELQHAATRKLMHENAKEFRDWFRDLLEGQRIEAEVERRIAMREAARQRGED